MNNRTALNAASSAFAILLFATGCNSSMESTPPELITPGEIRISPGNNNSAAPAEPSFPSMYHVQTGSEKFLRLGTAASDSPRQRTISENGKKITTYRIYYGTIEAFDASSAHNGDVRVLRYTDNDYADIFMDLISTEDRKVILEAGGKRSVSIPQGQYRYSGNNIFSVYGARIDNGWGAGTDFGKFFMIVNFSDGTGRIEGLTYGIEETSTILSLDPSRLYGDLTVSAVDGSFTGNEVKVDNLTKAFGDSTVQLTGNFHGENAQGVTGLYLNQDIFGSIAGVRNLPDRDINYVNVFNNGYNLSKVETDEGILFRFGHEDETALQGKYVLENLEQGKEQIWLSNETGEYVWNVVNVGKQKHARSLSLLKKEELGVYMDKVFLPENQLLLEAGGDRPSSLPRGKFQYSGTMMFGVVGTRSDNGFGTGQHFDIIGLSADFDNATGYVQGYIGYRYPTHNQSETLDGGSFGGDFDIISETGEFIGSKNVYVKHGPTQKKYPAVLHGSFHGEGAKGVSGVFVQRSDTPYFYGTIAGKLSNRIEDSSN